MPELQRSGRFERPERLAAPAIRRVERVARPHRASLSRPA